MVNLKRRVGRRSRRVIIPDLSVLLLLLLTFLLLLLLALPFTALSPLVVAREVVLSPLVDVREVSSLLDIEDEVAGGGGISSLLMASLSSFVIFATMVVLVIVCKSCFMSHDAFGGNKEVEERWINCRDFVVCVFATADAAAAVFFNDGGEKAETAVVACVNKMDVATTTANILDIGRRSRDVMLLC